MTFQAIYYRDSRGQQQVKDFIRTLDDACQDDIDFKIDMLNGLSDSNPHLPFPHSSALKGKDYTSFRELRADCGKLHYRILFRRHDRFFILLHMVYKTDKLEEGDKLIALQRWNDFIDRMTAKVRNPPAGHG